VNEICPLLKKYGIQTIVDSVSALGGEALETDEWAWISYGPDRRMPVFGAGIIDHSISDDAWNRIIRQKTAVIGFYCNLSIWKDWYQESGFRTPSQSATSML
jgi:aspartate aminotransferase-like enzyme